MNLIQDIEAQSDNLASIRRDFHRHPELGFEEKRTSKIVAELLTSWGIEVHSGIGGTGVVGVLKGNEPGNRVVGLRVDMDALPMEERTNLSYASTTKGRFHGCGHDGHMAMLLGAAQYLANTRQFSGQAVFIFQPAEEGLGGAKAMLGDRLFEKFRCDEIYGIHNDPLAEFGTVTVKPGTAFAGATSFDIDIRGKGGHGAYPHNANDPIVISASLIQGLQAIISRYTDATKPAVLSVTKIHGGEAYNVIPESVSLGGTIRYFDDGVKDRIFHRMHELCRGTAAAYDVEIDVRLEEVFSVLSNDPELSDRYLDIARDMVGDENTLRSESLGLGSEDFSDMLKIVPGAYCTIGHGSGVPLHNPGFIFDDRILPVAASLLARIVETRLPVRAGRV